MIKLESAATSYLHLEIQVGIILVMINLTRDCSGQVFSLFFFGLG